MWMREYGRLSIPALSDGNLRWVMIVTWMRISTFSNSLCLLEDKLLGRGLILPYLYEDQYSLCLSEDKLLWWGSFFFFILILQLLPSFLGVLLKLVFFIWICWGFSIAFLMDWCDSFFRWERSINCFNSSGIGCRKCGSQLSRNMHFPYIVWCEDQIWLNLNCLLS